MFFHLFLFFSLLKIFAVISISLFFSELHVFPFIYVRPCLFLLDFIEYFSDDEIKIICVSLNKYAEGEGDHPFQQ